jgi:hypothetical protein
MAYSDQSFSQALPDNTGRCLFSDTSRGSCAQHWFRYGLPRLAEMFWFLGSSYIEQINFLQGLQRKVCRYSRGAKNQKVCPLS